MNMKIKYALIGICILILFGIFLKKQTIERQDELVTAGVIINESEVGSEINNETNQGDIASADIDLEIKNDSNTVVEQQQEREVESQVLQEKSPEEEEEEIVREVVVSDVSYGSQVKEVLDLYHMSNTSVGAPLVIMVHGGAWRLGDKTNSNTLTNKKNHFVNKGYYFASVNYPLYPEVSVQEQIESVARSIKYLQDQSATYGYSPNKIVVMGHSAGSHLVAAVSANKEVQNVQPWKGTILLDSQAYDVPQYIASDGSALIKRVFTDSDSYHESVSPYHLVAKTTESVLFACSRQLQGSCDAANRYAGKLESLGTSAAVESYSYSHSQMNDLLGLNNSYTQTVQDFIDSVL